MSALLHVALVIITLVSLAFVAITTLDITNDWED